MKENGKPNLHSKLAIDWHDEYANICLHVFGILQSQMLA